MDLGRVRWFSESEGYGFIEHSDGREVYFHYTAVHGSGPNKSIITGATVYFDLLDTQSGLEAANIKIVSTENEIAV